MLLCFSNRTFTLFIVLSFAGAAAGQSPRNPPTRTEPQTENASAPISGNFLVIPGLQPLSMPNVQREIDLTADQRRQLKAVSDTYVAAMQRMDKTFAQLGPEEQRTKGKDYNEQASQAWKNAQRKAEGILRPQQLRAVQKIVFELSATGKLADPQLQQKIGLSTEQQQRLAQIFEQAGEKMQQLQRQTAQQTMQVLNNEQTAALKKQLDAQK